MRKGLFCLLLFLGLGFLQPLKAVTIQVDSVWHVRCAGEPTGAIYITILTDTTYFVEWLNVPWFNLDGIDAINLYANTYRVRVVASDGTEAVLDIVVEQPPHLAFDLVEQYPPDCRGNDGLAVVHATGGTPDPASPWGYTYEWETGNTDRSQAIPFPGHYYELTVTDKNGCSIAQSFGGFPEYPFYPLDSNVAATLTCFNRTMWLGADTIPSKEIKSSGLEPFTYHWSASNGGSIISNPDTSYIHVDAAGTYHITVTNEANGCTFESFKTVLVDTIPPLAEAGVDKFLTCNTSTDTLFTIVAGPPDPDVFVYGYWEGPFVLEYLGDLGIVIGGPGNYALTAVNTTNGCSATDTVHVIALNNSPSLTTEGGIIGCLSDSTTITAVFDSLNTRFEGWFFNDTLLSTEQSLTLTDPATLSLQVVDTVTGCVGRAVGVVYVDTFPPYLEFDTDSLFCASPNARIRIAEDYYYPEDSIYFSFAWTGPLGFQSTNHQPWVQVAGTYQLTLTYLPSGCTSLFMVEVPSDDDQAPTLLVQDAVIYLDTNGVAVLLPEQIDAGSTDGCGSITEWSLEADAFNCTNLGENAVTVTAYDQNGNSTTATVQVTVLDTLAPTLFCPDNMVRGHCDAQVIFGTPLGFDNCLPAGGLEAEQFGGLPPGATFPAGITTQRFRVQDGSGNSTTCSFTITILPPVDDVVFTTMQPACAGDCNGEAQVTVAGGAPPFVFLWNSGDTTDMITGLCAGMYTITVVDNMGCSDTWTTLLAEPIALGVVVDTVVHDIDSLGMGTIAITLNGGTPPYRFEWLSGDIPFANTEDVDSLYAGTYSCNILDANNCLIRLEGIVVDNTVETQEAWWAMPLRLYPNPTSGWTRVQLTEGVPGTVQLRVFDPGGRQVLSLLVPEGTRSWPLNLSALPAGSYLLQIQIGAERSMLFLEKLR